MEKISDIVKIRLGRHGLSSSAQAAEVLHTANQILSERLKTKEPAAKAYRLENGVLFVAAENSSWCQEVWGVQKSILDKLIQRFGKGVVRKICIKCLTIQ